MDRAGEGVIGIVDIVTVLICRKTCYNLRSVIKKSCTYVSFLVGVVWSTVATSEGPDPSYRFASPNMKKRTAF